MIDEKDCVAGYFMGNYTAVSEVSKKFSRTCVLLICAYISQSKGFFYLRTIDLLKFWVVIIAARISQLWTIKLINGIIEFDEKLASILPTLIRVHRSPNKKLWDTFFIAYSVYYIGFKAFFTYLSPPKSFDVDTIATSIFSPPFITEFAVTITSCFYLEHLRYRYQTLNDAWKWIHAARRDGRLWTRSEVEIFADNVRLLHARLSRLLKTFSTCYGPVLLSFFVLSFVNLLVTFFFIVCTRMSLPNSSLAENLMHNLPSHILNILNGQNVIFLLFTVVAASRVIIEKRKIISDLRVNRISNLPVGIKHQVIMFMNQISIFEKDEMTAFGFFNINLTLIITILVLLITGLSTLIQMKEHPIVYLLVNNTIALFS